MTRYKKREEATKQYGMQAGEEETIEYKSEYGCNTQNSNSSYELIKVGVPQGSQFLDPFSFCFNDLPFCLTLMIYLQRQK